MEFLKSIGPFAKQMWLLVGVAGAAAVNPARIAKALGMVRTEADFPFPIWAYKLVLMGILFGGMFVWFHRTRLAFESGRNPKPTKSLPEMLRFVATRSSWAAAQTPEDDRWVTALAKEVLNGLSLGRLTAYGRRCAPHKEHAQTPIEPGFWSKVSDFPVFQIMLDNTSSHLIHNDSREAFADLFFDQAGIERVWPRRNLMAAILRRSPAEKWGQLKEWAERDKALNAMERSILRGLSERFNDKYGQ